MNDKPDNLREQDFVDAVLPNARILKLDDGTVTLEVANLPEPLCLPYGAVLLGQTRPLHWPPQPGDVWRDGGNDDWFFYSEASTGELRRRNASGSYVGEQDSAQTLLEGNAPLRLQYRVGGIPS